MTGTSGAFRDDGAFRRGAAGHSATSDVDAGKRRRFRRPWRAALLVLTMTGVLAAAVWVLFGSRLLAVRSVVVSGTHLVPVSEILAVAGIRPGTPLIRVDTAQVAARVDTIRQVRSARVSRSWPDRVIIVVREWTPALALTAPGGGYDLVAADGVVVQWAARRPPGFPLFPAPAAGSSLSSNPDLAAAAAVLAGLPAELRDSVQSVTAPSPDQVTLHLTGGMTVLWGGPERAAAKARELAALAGSGQHYVDVSAPGSVTAG